MAKVTAPLLSLDAAGTFGKTMTFGKWKGRHYVRQRVTPTNPNSANQQTQRSKFRDAVAGWQALDQAIKDTWNTRVKELGLTMSGFNLYVREFIAQGILAGSDPVLP